MQVVSIVFAATSLQVFVNNMFQRHFSLYTNTNMYTALILHMLLQIHRCTTTITCECSMLLAMCVYDTPLHYLVSHILSMYGLLIVTCTSITRARESIYTAWYDVI
jgi:hypothetical protein